MLLLVSFSSSSPNPSDEASLVHDLQQGSQSAFTTFVNTYKTRVFSTIYNIVANPHDASDITQEVFIKAIDAIHSFKAHASLSTWLYRIAVNMALSFIRKHKNRTPVSLDELDESGFTPQTLQVIPTEAGADRTATLKELQKKLNEAIQNLSNKHRVVFVLFEIEGMSHEQIAKIVGCSVGTVRSRLHYAKQQLQAYLRDYL